MVSNYRRKTTRRSYSKENLQEAVQAVKNGHLSGYKAAQVYDIPRMTIMDHVKNRRCKSTTLGRNTALSPDLEANLVSLLHLMEKYGFGLSKEEVLQLVGDYVKKNSVETPFKNGIPGTAWFAGFKERHNLSIKKPQGVEYARKRAMDPFIVFPYFDLLWKTMNELNITDQPAAIWNLDETSFSQDPEKTKVVGIKGYSSTRVISSPGKNNTTVLLGACANGNKTPPLIIFKGKNVWDQWIAPDAYPGTSYAATKNGWMETDVFEMFFKKSFLPTVGNQRPILLIYDGHATHVGLNIIEEARKNGITILKLPPHTSHVLQPLDVSVMKSFKDRWDPLLVKWQRKNVGVSLPKKEFARLIGVVWAEIEKIILVNGFRKAGIFPWNPEAIKNDQYDTLKLKKWNKYKTYGCSEADNNKINPPSLQILALNCINEKMKQCSPVSIIHQDQASQDHESECMWINNESINNPNDSNKKITVLEDNIIGFEELLLAKVKAGSNTKARRQKMAPGAEVITHEDVVRRKREEKNKNIKSGLDARKMKIDGKPINSKNAKNQPKRKTQRKTTKDKSTPDETSNISSINYESDKENSSHTDITDLPTSTIKKNGSSTSSGIRKIKKEKNIKERKKCLSKPERKKRVQMQSNDYTSVSDCMSIHSDIPDTPYFGPSTSSGIRKIKKEKKIKERKKCLSKPKIIKMVQMQSSDSASVSDCMSILSHSNIYDTNETFDIEIQNSITVDQNKEQGAPLEAGNDEHQTERHIDLAPYKINDHVMVQYYNRKKWTHYVGYIENVTKNNEDVIFTIRFYKTIKKAQDKKLKFSLTKKIDRDDVPMSSIVKKVEMINDPNNSKELSLCNEDDAIYF